MFQSPPCKNIQEIHGTSRRPLNESIPCIEHFFLYCQEAKLFWDHWNNWWTYITDIDISKSKITAECILFGFPGEDDMITVLNYCVLIAKYFIYSRKITQNNNLDLYQYLVYLKYKLNLEYDSCAKSKPTTFEKYKIIYNSL